MNFIQILILIFKYGPAVFAIVKEIIDLIKNVSDPTDKAVLKSDLEAAVAEYKKTKDASLLETVRARARKRCRGPNCPVG